MEVSGLLRIRVHRGINLAVRDKRGTSDPYAVVKSGLQKVRSKVLRDTLNPVWEDDLTIHIKDLNLPVILTVYDKDTFTDDDNMGHAQLDIKPLFECTRMGLEDLYDGTTVEKIEPSPDNCLAEQSRVVWTDGKMSQEMKLKLRNVETGEVEIRIEWTDLPGDVGIHI
ncbi:protein C2-DOMAIN ABA-RELATED 4-like [Andrographis paniculata]|uniref:protein C2-DOMAIN ABA-RELATED 4-like n=1 Tax=Andrographis paniculata TaxID=175694 RepID=UPI0021E8AB1C|nr:protein C2-DOMAIN ABA-RELATED 4-like [Andrographis paniculata]